MASIYRESQPPRVHQPHRERGYITDSDSDESFAATDDNIVDVDADHNFVGTDYSFVDTVPAKLTCFICTNVLSDPRLTECCGQHFCQKCLQSWLEEQRKKSCPHCRQRNFAHILDRSVRREINQLKVHCSHHEEGCEWEGELGDLQTHLDSEEGCGCVEVECPNGCIDAFLEEESEDEGIILTMHTTTICRKDLEEHFTNECDQRRYNCKYCGEEGTYQNITDHHYSTCPNFPLNCPNKCCEIKFKRKDIPTHREQCPLERAQCPFQEAGCETRLVRKDLEEHMTSQTQQHLLLTLKRTKSLEQECSQLKMRNTELDQKFKKRNGGLVKRYKKLQERNTELELRCTMLEISNGDLEERCTKLEQVNTEHTFKKIGLPRKVGWRR